MAFEEAVQPFAEQASLFVPFIMVAVVTLFILGILSFALWIYMIVDCAKRRKFRHGDQVLWILLLVLTGAVGMTLYYFMEMRKR